MKIYPIVYPNINFKKTPYVNKSQTVTQKNPLDAYSPKISVTGNKNDGFTFFVNYVEAKDEEKYYTFKPNGSATSRSLAWGITTECPIGSFSEAYAKLPNNATDIKHETAMELIKLYKNNPNKSDKSFAPKKAT